MKPGDITQFGTVAQVFPFKSKTNPNHSYQCLLYTDNTTSCNCKGWTNARNGKRSCKHTELVDGQVQSGGTVTFAAAPTRRAPVAGRRFDLNS